MKMISYAWLAAAVAFQSTAALAQGAQTIMLSASLVEEIFQKLARQPYGEVAPTITKLQSEVQHQPGGGPGPPPAIPHPKE